MRCPNLSGGGVRVLAPRGSVREGTCFAVSSWPLCPELPQHLCLSCATHILQPDAMPGAQAEAELSVETSQAGA